MDSYLLYATKALLDEFEEGCDAGLQNRHSLPVDPSQNRVVTIYQIQHKRTIPTPWNLSNLHHREDEVAPGHASWEVVACRRNFFCLAPSIVADRDMNPLGIDTASKARCTVLTTC